jgi:nitrogen fixation protein FixH
MPHPRSRGWWYPWIFVGGMGIVVAVNAVLISAAIGTFPGFETRDHYRKGLAYNENLAAAREQDRLGWQVQLAFQPEPESAGGHRGRLDVRFADATGGALPQLEVEARLMRPTHQGYDQTLMLAGLGDGRYQGTIALPLPGQWEVRILARDGDRHFQATRRLIVP